MVVQELGWDSDTDDELRIAIEDALDSDMVDGDYGNVVDAVLLWWRNEDGDLVDGLVDSLTDLVGGGVDLADDAEGRPTERRGAGRHHRGCADRRSRPDHHGGGEQGLGGDAPGHPEVARVTSPSLGAHSAVGRVLHRGLGVAGTVGTPVRVLGGSGIVRPLSPAVLARIGKAIKAWGTGPAGGFTAMALRDPGRVALVDEIGALTFGELHRRSNALARALAARGVHEGDSVAIMCRNHRGFVDACVATAKLGADILLLNTAFAGPQLVEVLEREGPSAVIHDEEFTGLLERAETGVRILGWVDSDTAEESMESLIPAYDGADLDAPEHHSRIVILTSGTTGTPKGAPRSEAGVGAAVSLMSRMPLRYGWRTHIAAPLFHTWGFAHLALSMLLGSTVVLRRKFVPEACLKAVTDESMRLPRRDPGDAAAGARAAGRHPRPLPTALAEGDGRVRLGAAGRPRPGVDGPVRRQPLQHLRLDRGRLRVDRDTARPACGADLRREAALGDGGEDPGRRGTRGAHGGVRPDLRRERPAVRGLHRWRVEGGRRRPDVVGRRRPVRRRRAASTSRAATTR